VEFNVERIAILAALFAMAGSIAVKIVTIQLLKGMRKAIEALNQRLLEARRNLGKAKSSTNVNDREQLKVQGNHNKVSTQLHKLKSELSELKRTESEKQKQRAAMRGKLE